MILFVAVVFYFILFCFVSSFKRVNHYFMLWCRYCRMPLLCMFCMADKLDLSLSLFPSAVKYLKVDCYSYTNTSTQYKIIDFICSNAHTHTHTLTHWYRHMHTISYRSRLLLMHHYIHEFFCVYAFSICFFLLQLCVVFYVLLLLLLLLHFTIIHCFWKYSLTVSLFFHFL